MVPQPEFPKLPFDSFREQLDTVVRATINKVDREWPTRFRDHSGAHALVEGLLRTAENTYFTIRYIVADHPKDPSRRPEFALTVPPITRTLLDTLFTLVFAYEDLPRMTRWYYTSGWRELVEEQERQRERYGEKESWKAWLAEKDAMIAATKDQWGVSESEAAKPSSIKWWPTPGAMRNSTAISPERREYLTFLNDWFYKSLSSQSHLSWPGLAYRSAALIPNQDKEEVSWRLAKQKSDVFATSAVLLLAIVSEVEAEFRFGLGDRMKYVWTLLGGFYGHAQELYDMRYEQRL